MDKPIIVMFELYKKKCDLALLEQRGKRMSVTLINIVNWTYRLPVTDKIFNNSVNNQEHAWTVPSGLSWM